MATEELASSPPAAGDPPAKTGHPTGFWFFFWGEFAERSSYYGMRAILALYLVERLGFDKADGATVMSLFIAACYLLPIVGGLIADNVLGKYWTIVGFSLPYLLGHVILGIEDKYAVFGALALLAMGSGVIKPNISTLMGMTYDQQRPGQEQLRSEAFSWFYLAINIGAFISQLGVPYVRTHYGYQMAFLFPTILMAVALAIFAAGKRFYADEWRDRPKVMTPEEKAEAFRLKLQTLGRISLLFLLVMFFWAIFDQSASTWIYFADTYMDTRLLGVETSADAIQAFNPLFIMALLPLSVVLFRLLANAGRPIRPTTRIGVGFVLTGLSMAIMSTAGYLAGEKQQVVRLTTDAGTFHLPLTDLAAVTPADAAAGVKLGPAVNLSAKDWGYDADKKRGTFKDGTLDLGNGLIVALTDGRLDFFRSRGLVVLDAVGSGSALELKLKPGRYAHGPDTIEVGENGLTRVVQEPPPPPAADTPPVTVTVVDWVAPNERVTVWWQVLAYLILTMAEILISVTGLELAYTAAPAGMKSFVTACWLFTVFLANFLINTPITRIYPLMEPGAYFAMLGGAMVVVMVLFIPIAMRFNRVSGGPRASDMAEGITEEK